MDIRKVKKIMELLEDSDMSEIEVSSGEESVRISRYGKSVAPQIPIAASPVAAVAAVESAPTTKDGHPITAPMVGTFYNAASPESAPFVKIGQHIDIGDTVCIIEAMKIMNQVEADQSGTVAEILCENGDGVEFGQVIVVIK